MSGLTNKMIVGANVVDGWIQADAMGFEWNGSLVAATTTGVGAVLKLQNTTGKDLIVTDVILSVTTAAAAANSIDLGVDDGGDVSSDNLIDGLAMNAVGVHCNAANHGNNGGKALWKKNEYIVATASATLASLVGTYKIRAIVA